jgi:lysozyme
MALLDKLKLAALIGPAAAVAAVALTSGSEGVRLTPYQDKLGHGVATVCFGDTEVEMRRYTLVECKDLLSARLADYANPVRDMTPGFDALTDGQKAAVIDFTYNTGIATYKNSSLRRDYSAKRFPQACDQFIRYKFTSGKDCTVASNHCGGIMTRRYAERAACRGE